MFDIGFSEMLVICVVALVVLGPERLPVVARTVGRMLSRFQGHWREVKSEIEREIQVDKIRDIEHSAQTELAQLENDLNAPARELTTALNSPPTTPEVSSSAEGQTPKS